MRTLLAAIAALSLSATLFAQVPDAETLPGTTKLELAEPLDVVMVRGINEFAEQEIALSRERRARHWNRDYSSVEAYEKSIAPNRERLKTYIGAVEERVTSPRVLHDFHHDLLVPFGTAPGAPIIQAEVFPGVTVEMLYSGTPRVILVPDADWSPEAAAGELVSDPDVSGPARRLSDNSLEPLIVRLISRSDEFSGHPDIGFTNQPHREFLYRPAFELGRHIIGYEVQKILRAVDVVETLALTDNDKGHPIVVWGIGEGGLLAMHAAALDPRIDVCIVSGYFSERESVWQEPIYRNVWRQLAEFGDADIASLIAPRRLIIEACAVPEVSGPPAPHDGRRGGAAPGAIRTPDLATVEREFERAKAHYDKLGASDRIQLVKSDGGKGPPATDDVIRAIMKVRDRHEEIVPRDKPLEMGRSEVVEKRIHAAQKRQVEELRHHTQRLLHQSDKARDKVWAKADRSSLAAWENTQEPYRDFVYDELIGRIPYDLLPLNARSRKIIDEPTHVGYEITLDVFQSEWSNERAKAQGLQPLGFERAPIIAGGILLVPKNLKPGEKRPCVVCQHGLEGTPMDTIVTDPSAPGYGPYKGFSTQLVQQGFIVYAPQNPYRGHDEFRVIQRKSNPLGRSLFSYIIPQHQQTLNWLATLPYVDADRIAFYGLSYGGKTAMRVPPMLPGFRLDPELDIPFRSGSYQQGDPVPYSPGYCLSICSADFNEWVLKNASTEDRYSYVFTNEYEIFEWNMGHVANYAELASLMTPRPFMVERGHDDGVAPDEWVAWEFAKVKRHYDKLGIGDRAEIEVFNGPHTINGKGTFDFLHRHLNWP